MPGNPFALLDVPEKQPKIEKPTGLNQTRNKKDPLKDATPNPIKDKFAQFEQLMSEANKPQTRAFFKNMPSNPFALLDAGKPFASLDVPKKPPKNKPPTGRDQTRNKKETSEDATNNLMKDLFAQFEQLVREADKPKTQAYSDFLAAKKLHKPTSPTFVLRQAGDGVDKTQWANTRKLIKDNETLPVPSKRDKTNPPRSMNKACVAPSEAAIYKKRGQASSNTTQVVPSFDDETFPTLPAVESKYSLF